MIPPDIDWPRVIEVLASKNHHGVYIAKKCGVHYNTVGRWKSGYTKPDWERGAKLLNYALTKLDEDMLIACRIPTYLQHYQEEQ